MTDPLFQRLHLWQEALRYGASTHITRLGDQDGEDVVVVCEPGGAGAVLDALSVDHAVTQVTMRRAPWWGRSEERSDLAGRVALQLDALGLSTFNLVAQGSGAGIADALLQRPGMDARVLRYVRLDCSGCSPSLRAARTPLTTLRVADPALRLRTLREFLERPPVGVLWRARQGDLRSAG